MGLLVDLVLLINSNAMEIRDPGRALLLGLNIEPVDFTQDGLTLLVDLDLGQRNLALLKFGPKGCFEILTCLGCLGGRFTAFHWDGLVKTSIFCYFSITT